MKVLFLVNWWYPDRVSALNGIFVKKHAEAVARKAEIAVLYLGNVPGMKKNSIDTGFDEEDGIPTVRVYYKKARGFLSPFQNQARYFRAVRKGLTLLPPGFRRCDVLHIHIIPPPVFLLFRFLFFRKIPYIVSEHSSAYLPLNLKSRPTSFFHALFIRPFAKRLVKKASAVTVPSGALEAGMSSIGYSNRYEIIPNVVDTRCFYPLEEEAEADKIPGTFKLLHVSGLKKLKNVAGILRVLHKLRETRENFEFHVVGDGEEKESLEKTSREMGMLNRDVFFHGPRGVGEVAEIMRGSDIFILFSDYENSPCVIVESMASGLPVIATDVGGIPELVNEKTGVLVQPGDEAELLNAIDSMMDNYGTYDRVHIREEAVKRFSYETVGQRFFNLYETRR